jgi:hypothetical protein
MLLDPTSMAASRNEAEAAGAVGLGKSLPSFELFEFIAGL